MNAIDVQELSYSEWQQLRKQFIGGSDVATALGKNPYQTPYMLWLEKTGRFEFDYSNPVTRFGQIFESHVREEFSRRTGFEVKEPDRMFIHPAYDCLAANVDGIIQPNTKHPGKGILEIKTTLKTRIPVLGCWEDVPVEYQHQIQHYLGIMGFEYAYLQLYYRDSCTYSKPLLVLPDQSMIDRNNRELADWWKQYVIEDTPPPLSTDEDLKLRYPSSKDGSRVQASEEIVKKYHALRQVRERINQLEQLKESFEFDLKKYIGETESLVDDDRLLATWKNSTRRQFDSTTFQQDYPKLYNQYTNTNSLRIFRLK